MFRNKALTTKPQSNLANGKLPSNKDTDLNERTQLIGGAALTPKKALQLQKTLGNRTVIQLMKSLSGGKEEDKDEDPAELPTMKSESSMEDDDIYFSGDEVEERDEETTLTEREMMEIILKVGNKNKQILDKSPRPVPNEEGVYHIDDPYKRKVFANWRTQNYIESNKFQIGHQYLSIQNGRGNFIAAGGNQLHSQKTKRDENMKEPPADYDNLIEGMKQEGAKDPVAIMIYKLATGGKITGHEREAAGEIIEKEIKEDTKQEEDRVFKNDRLSDAELSVILLYCLNHEVPYMKWRRTYMTESLQKFVSITGISELARSFDAEKVDEHTKKTSKSPYSAETLIKMSLKTLIQNTSKLSEKEPPEKGPTQITTLKELFYNGENSIFLGAKTGRGAQVLKHPLDSNYDKELKRQMSIFPKNKKMFKELLNSVTRGRKTIFIEEIEQIRKSSEALIEAEWTRYLVEVDTLIKDINAALDDHKEISDDNIYDMEKIITVYEGYLSKVDKKIKRLNIEVDRFQKAETKDEKVNNKIADATTKIGQLNAVHLKLKNVIGEKKKRKYVMYRKKTRSGSATVNSDSTPKNSDSTTEEIKKKQKTN
ncbi:hypothetical protein [Brevibacillus porteri]|uniref:hypothetical protein n=1 Tax=Brevibacillus porteri TaxID=2126350 RepID=UPI003D1DF11A